MKYLHERAMRIISVNDDDKLVIRSIENQVKMRACSIVRNCIDGIVCENFQNYFSVIDHTIATRNNKHLLRLPKVKTEYARKSFYFCGAKEYNKLPLNLRIEDSSAKFRVLLRDHFASAVNL
jgi:hypothetical protein